MFTGLLAVTVFGERLTRREALAAAIVITGATVISGTGGPIHAELLGALAVTGACLAWALITI